MKRIEVFVKSIESCFTEIYIEKGCEHTATGKVDIHRPQSRFQHKKMKELPLDHRRVLEIVKKVAETKQLEVRIYDLSMFSGRIKARFRKVDKTPAIFLDGNKIEGVLEIEQHLQVS